MYNQIINQVLGLIIMAVGAVAFLMVIKGISIYNEYFRDSEDYRDMY